jgi:hypothetical protein
MAMSQNSGTRMVIAKIAGFHGCFSPDGVQKSKLFPIWETMRKEHIWENRD